MNPESLLASFGYLALFTGTVLEGETFVVIAVIMAQKGHLNMVAVLGVAFSGAVVGDQCCFFLGKTRGAAFLKQRPHWQKHSLRIHGLIKRWQTAVVLGYRFCYGFRAVTPFFIGMNRFNVYRFIILSLIGTILWLSVLSSAGILLGRLVLQIISDYRNTGQWALGAGIIATAIVLAVRFRPLRK